MFYFLRRTKFLTTTFFVDFVLKLKGIKIIEAKTDKEKKMVYKLRYDIYNEYGYINPKDFPSRELKDEDDEHSISYLSFKNNKPIGTVRLILGNKKEDFPIFKMWNIDFDKFSVPFSKIGEISKLGVINLEKREKHEILFKMVKMIYSNCKKINIDYCAFFSPDKIKYATEKKLNTPVYLIPCLESIEANFKERTIMINYFKSLNPSIYFVKVKEFGKR